MEFGRHASDLSNDFRKNKFFDDGVEDFGLLGLCSVPIPHPYKHKKNTEKEIQKNKYIASL